ncbi:MAG TPA: aryl-sulfate sulfotransferase [Pseudomonadales bacterium]|nr:aryl-sulfate sulfotransferase [Pseudomonadales bacterium]
MARSEHHPNGLIHYNPQLAYRGYTLFSADVDKAFLIDMEGRIVHQWQSPRGISNPTLLPTGHLMALGTPDPESAGLRGLAGQSPVCFELDWDGVEVWRHEDPFMHHDYERLPNGNTLVVKWAPLPKSLVRRVKGGYVHEDDDPDAMLGDLIVELTPTGEVVREWKSWADLDPKTDHICPIDNRKEWTHCNSISLAPNGDWLVSYRRLSMVAQVNPKTGKYRWKYTDPSMSHQHDARYSGPDTITIFDNGVHRRSIEYSRVIEVNAKTREVVWEFKEDPPFSFFTVMGGGALRLPNDNVLICEMSKGQFFEVTRGGKVVWEYINPFFINNPRLGGRMNLVFRALRYGIHDPALAGRDLDPARYANLNRLYAPATA